MLKNARFGMGMVTCAPREDAEICLNTLGLSKYFRVIVSMEDLPKGVGKPSPEPFKIALAKLGFKPDECFVVEDSPNGVLSAVRAGIKCIGLQTPYLEDKEALRSAGAVVVVSSLREITLKMISGL